MDDFPLVMANGDRVVLAIAGGLDGQVVVLLGTNDVEADEGDWSYVQLTLDEAAVLEGLVRQARLAGRIERAKSSHAKR